MHDHDHDHEHDGHDHSHDHDHIHEHVFDGDDNEIGYVIIYSYTNSNFKEISKEFSYMILSNVFFHFCGLTWNYISKVQNYYQIIKCSNYYTYIFI